MNPRLSIRLASVGFAAALLAGCAETPEERSLSSTASVESETTVAPTTEPVTSDDDAGISWEQHLAGSSIGEIAVSLPPKAIVVAKVLGSVNDKATYAHPPTIIFGVAQKLLNDAVPDEIKVIWEPPPHDVDGGRNVLENPRYIEWAQTPMEYPKVGERFILMLVDPQSKIDTTPHYSCPSIGRYSDTFDNIRNVRDALHNHAGK